MKKFFLLFLLFSFGFSTYATCSYITANRQQVGSVSYPATGGGTITQIRFTYTNNTNDYIYLVSDHDSPTAGNGWFVEPGETFNFSDNIWCDPSGGTVHFYLQPPSECWEDWCPTCDSEYCSEHEKHQCINITCVNGNNHLYKETVLNTQNFRLDLRTIASNFDSGGSYVGHCSHCNSDYCTLCGHSCPGGVITPVPDPNNPDNPSPDNPNPDDPNPDDPDNPNPDNPNPDNPNPDNPDPDNPNPDNPDPDNPDPPDPPDPDNPNPDNPNPDEPGSNNGDISDILLTIYDAMAKEAKQDITNTRLSDIHTTVRMILTAINVTNSYLASIEDNTSNVSSGFAGVREDLSTLKSDISDIKNSLTTNQSSPAVRSNLQTISPSSSSLTIIRNKLVPGYSFFTISGNTNPSWTVNLPLHNFSPAARDMTIVIGGDDWNTAGNGILPWLANFVRMITQFAFAYIFLKMIITYLRQW